jgi:hypothetical protein
MPLSAAGTRPRSTADTPSQQRGSEHVERVRGPGCCAVLCCAVLAWPARLKLRRDTRAKAEGEGEGEAESTVLYSEAGRCR